MNDICEHLKKTTTLNAEVMIICLKPVRERLKPYELTHMRNLMNKLNYQGNRDRLGFREQTGSTGGKGLGGRGQTEKKKDS